MVKLTDTFIDFYRVKLGLAPGLIQAQTLYYQSTVKVKTVSKAKPLNTIKLARVIAELAEAAQDLKEAEKVEID